MRVALDTNILAYAEGINGPSMQQAARAVLASMIPSATVLPLQALGELYGLLVRKAKWSSSGARISILSWRDTFSVIETSDTVFLAGMDLAMAHRLKYLGRGDLIGCGGDGLPLSVFRRYARWIYLARRHRGKSVFCISTKTAGIAVRTSGPMKRHSRPKSPRILVP